jgi:hypothetical protein
MGALVRAPCPETAGIDVPIGVCAHRLAHGGAGLWDEEGEADCIGEETRRDEQCACGNDAGAVEQLVNGHLSLLYISAQGKQCLQPLMTHEGAANDGGEEGEGNGCPDADFLTDGREEEQLN